MRTIDATIRVDLEKCETRQRIPSPGKCIYCYGVFAPDELTDEHIIPYALAANTMVLNKSCCTSCQKEISRYEQAVLRHQLGTFRAQVDAPTRNKKDRITAVDIQFVEVDKTYTIVRDLGTRNIPIADAPLMINLWQSPPATILQERVQRPSEPWSFVEMEVAESLCRKVANEMGAVNVAMNVGKVNRLQYQRMLAKMAHAYATAELGLDAFEPCLTEIILNQSDDIEQFVGDVPGIGPFDYDPAFTLQISLGEIPDGPAEGYLVVRIQLYPSLKSPEHLVVVGKPKQDIGAWFA